MVGGRGLVDGIAGGGEGKAISGVISAGDLVPHGPWTSATMAARQETMTTRREAVGAAPVLSSYVDDV